MHQIHSGWIVLPAVAVIAIGVMIWKKKKHVYTKVGKVRNLYFYPVKSLKGIEVTEGKCTQKGFEINGLLDRSFMLINDEKVLVSQRQAPRLSLLSVHMSHNKLIISHADMDSLTIDIKSSPSPNDEIIKCQVHTDIVNVVDCGEDAAKWFQSYLKLQNIRLVRFFPEFPNRKYAKNHPFYKKLRNKYPVSLQDLAAFHIVSQPSVNDLNHRIGENKISVLNFRPNILVDECAPYAEDTWRYMKFTSGAEMLNELPVTRCLLTTVEPDTGILTSKEPLTTLRKYRIPKDPELRKKTDAIPCFGTACFTLQTGQIRINDDIFATVTKPFETIVKES